jgi:hypothetical protein
MLHLRNRTYTGASFETPTSPHRAWDKKTDIAQPMSGLFLFMELDCDPRNA